MECLRADHNRRADTEIKMTKVTARRAVTDHKAATAADHKAVRIVSPAATAILAETHKVATAAE